MTALDLTPHQSANLRRLLFEELQTAAELLAACAAVAVEGSSDSDRAGADANGACHRRLKDAAELLDMIGWSVRTHDGEGGE